MNEKNINNIIKEYKSFKEGLNNDIKKKLNSIKLSKKECFLIKKNWYDEFSNIIIEYEKNKNSKGKEKYLENFAKKKPEFINDIESVFNNFLINFFNLKLVSFNFIFLFIIFIFIKIFNKFIMK